MFNWFKNLHIGLKILIIFTLLFFISTCSCISGAILLPIISKNYQTGLEKVIESNFEDYFKGDMETSTTTSTLKKESTDNEDDNDNQKKKKEFPQTFPDSFPIYPGVANYDQSRAETADTVVFTVFYRTDQDVLTVSNFYQSALPNSSYSITQKEEHEESIAYFFKKGTKEDGNVVIEVDMEEGGTRVTISLILR